MSLFSRAILRQDDHKYTLVGQEGPPSRSWTKRRSVIVLSLVGFMGLVAAFKSWLDDWSWLLYEGAKSDPCDAVLSENGCQVRVAHHWGQYSPFFSVSSEIPRDIPRGCHITFAQVLSRHGARDPTLYKTKVYNATISKIQSNVKNFPGDYAFLANYEYNLGADQLTVFGEQELVKSGIQFFERYKGLTRTAVPFVRASGQERVVESARKWTQGFRDAKINDGEADDGVYPYVNVVISEDRGMNNTLSHDLCTEFESGPNSTIGHNAQRKWADIFVPAIQARFNNHLQGANLSVAEIVNLMDLCPFDTVASPVGTISTFCNLFSEQEWQQYDYLETLGKYYGYSHGNPLGPTQGVGFVNELIARLTGTAVHDHTSTNDTLDSSPETFPLDRQLYADFSHDNDLMGIFSALGLYGGISALPNTTLVKAPDANGFSAAWTVPFAARAVFEKMTCTDRDGELVRILINDRVLPLTQCDADELGRCTVDAFVDSLSFARTGGRWNRCFP